MVSGWLSIKISGKYNQGQINAIMNNILQYESKIWATADLLRGCGIKESEGRHS